MDATIIAVPSSTKSVDKACDPEMYQTRRGGEVDELQHGKNRNKSRIRARVEHVFAVVKRFWGFSKVRLSRSPKFDMEQPIFQPSIGMKSLFDADLGDRKCVLQRMSVVAR